MVGRHSSRHRSPRFARVSNRFQLLSVFILPFRISINLGLRDGVRGSHLSVGDYKLKRLRFFSTAFAVIVALSLVSPMSAQQAASSSVTGWVSDPSGAAIANAAVTLSDSAKGVSRTTS